METLQGAYGDPINITNERINVFIKWAQEAATPISKPDKIYENRLRFSIHDVNDVVRLHT